MTTRKYYPIKAFGFETQAPRWALTLLALILIAGIAMVIYRKTYAEPERVLVTLRDANKELSAEVEEYSLHAMEDPEKHELFEDHDGRLILRVFKDHCVLIQRQSKHGTRTKLVLDLDRASAIGAAFLDMEAPALPSILPVLEASGQGCQRGCLNPHPGAFSWWYGEHRGEWIEVWRKWPEGCQHVQMFHPRSGSWDSNPDGSARVRWVCCTH